MSNLTQEAILAELAKLSDGKGRAMSFYDGQTIVPNSLLEQVWLEAERKTEERIIKLLENNAHPKGVIGQMLQDNYVLEASECQEAAELLIALIKGEK